MLIFKFYDANNSKTGEGAIRQGNADKKLTRSGSEQIWKQESLPQIYFDFFRAKQGVPLTSTAVANFATENCI